MEHIFNFAYRTGWPTTPPLLKVFERKKALLQVKLNAIKCVH